MIFLHSLLLMGFYSSIALALIILLTQKYYIICSDACAVWKLHFGVHEEAPSNVSLIFVTFNSVTRKTAFLPKEQRSRLFFRSCCLINRPYPGSQGTFGA